MKDIMLDLETMGNGPLAAIIAIGAVEFDLASGKTGDEYYCVVDLASSIKAGGIIDASTVLWWMEQSSEARSAFSRPGISILNALKQFSGWLQNRNCLPKDICIWGNGAAFDNVILASAYRLNEIPLPWQFWNDRCYRTVKALNPGIKMQRTGTHHNAVDDARSQAQHLITMMSKS